MIGEGEGDHGFDHGDGAGQDTRVVAAFAFEGRIFVLGGDGVLFREDGGNGLEGHAESDGHAVGDTALDAAGVVGGCVNGLVVVAAVGVVVFGTS